MKIQSTIYGFYQPKMYKGQTILVAGEFIRVNLGAFLGALCREPVHEMHVVRSVAGKYIPIAYFKEWTGSLDDGPETLHKNSFIINEALLEEEISQSGYDPVSIMLILWGYVFHGVRFKLQEYVLRLEDLFGYEPGKKDDIVYREDAFFVSYFGQSMMEHVFKGTKADPERFRKVLCQRLTEYSGPHDPKKIISYYNSAMGERVRRSN